MDIKWSDYRDQVSPQPWMLQRSALPLEDLIRANLKQHPEATPDEIVARLAAQDVQAPGTYVATLIAQARGDGAPLS